MGNGVCKFPCEGSLMMLIRRATRKLPKKVWEQKNEEDKVKNLVGKKTTRVIQKFCKGRESYGGSWVKEETVRNY